MSYYGGILSRKEKRKMRRERQERRRTGYLKRDEMRRRATAYHTAMVRKEERTPEGRAECLLRGLQADVERFYEHVKLRAGLGQERPYEWQDGNILGPGSYYDAAVQGPMAGAGRDEIDEFLKKPGRDPRNFLSREKLKGMAYRLSRAVTIISEMPEPDASTLSEYRGVVAGLKQSGLYEALLKRRRGLAGKMADFEKRISNMQVDMGPGADSYSDGQDLTYRDDGPPRGHHVRTVWH